MQSERVALSTTPTADTWTLVGTFTVPAGVESLKKIGIGISIDPGAASTARIAPAIRLIGSGLLEQSPHEYLASAGNFASPASGGGAIELKNQEYDVDIPVSTGGTYEVQVNFIAEGAVPMTAKVQATYSPEKASGKNSMSVYVTSAQPTAADAWQTVGIIVVPKMEGATSPKTIKEVCMMHATDQAVNATLRSSSAFRLSGAGIAEGGDHTLNGPSGGAFSVTTGWYTYENRMVRTKIEIPVNAGGSILVEARIDAELPSAGTVAVGVLFE